MWLTTRPPVPVGAFRVLDGRIVRFQARTEAPGGDRMTSRSARERARCIRDGLRGGRGLALLLLALLLLPVAGRAQDVPEQPVGAVGIAGTPQDAPPDPLPCTCSETCAGRHGYGSV